MLDGVLEYTDGVEVDDAMQTALPDVYAAGDIVRARMRFSDSKSVRAIWPNAVAQGAVAGKNMAGVRTLFEGSQAMNSIKLFGVSFISAGQIEAKEGQEEVLLRNTPGAYHKLILENGVLVGVTFAGSDSGRSGGQAGSPSAATPLAWSRVCRLLAE
jgi:NAD(P)H-nitrite reductase large subunit